MKIFTKMAAAILACLLAVPGEARVNVVYQRQDSLRIVGLLQQARATICCPTGIISDGSYLSKKDREIMVI